MKYIWVIKLFYLIKNIMDEKKEFDIYINQLNYETLKEELNKKYNIDLDNYDLFYENGNKIDNNDLFKVKDRKINLKKK